MKLFPFGFWKTEPAPSADLVLYLNAQSVANVLANLDPVPLWPDLSGFAHDMVQANVSKQPILHYDEDVDLFPYITGDGVNDALVTPDSPLLRLNDTAASLVLFFRTSMAGNDIFPFCHYSSSENNGWAMRIIDSVMGFENRNGWEGFGTGGINVRDGNWHAAVIRWSNGYATVVVDGRAQFTIPAAYGDGTAHIDPIETPTRLFELGNGATFFAGDILEARAYLSARTPNQIFDLFNTYAIAYNLTVLGDALPHICFQGDSLTAGEGAPPGSDYPQQLIDELGDWAHENNGVIGETILEILHAAPHEWQSCLNHFSSENLNFIIMWGGANDLGTHGRTPAQCLTDIKLFFTEAKKMFTSGVKFCAVTILPSKGAGWSPTFETDRTALNELMRAVPLGDYWDYLADVGANATIGQPDSPDDPTYFSMDKIHLTAAGYAIVANVVGVTIGQI